MRIHNTWSRTTAVRADSFPVSIRIEEDKRRRYHLAKLQNVDWWSLLLRTKAIDEATATGRTAVRTLELLQ